MAYVNFEDLKGMTLIKIEQKGTDELHFYTGDNRHFVLLHYQDCCESVEIEDICGDLNTLLYTPILLAEVSTKSGDSEWESETWTFYKLSTIKGDVTIRWYGASNGYYSEEVSFVEYEGAH